MKVNGRIINFKDKAYINSPMAVNFKEIGLIIRLMV